MASPSAICREQYAPDVREAIYACNPAVVHRAEPLESFAAPLAEINRDRSGDRDGQAVVRAVAAPFDTCLNRGVARHSALV
jgi:hypothetical protein